MSVVDLFKASAVLQMLMLLSAAVAFLLFVGVNAVVSLPPVAENPYIWGIPGVAIVFGVYSWQS